MRTIEEIRAEIKAVQARGRAVNSLQNEGGEGYDHTDEARIEALTDELAAVKYATDWSRENTIAKRAEWNAVAKRIGKCRDAVARIEAETGYRMTELIAAVQHHNL